MRNNNSFIIFIKIQTREFLIRIFSRIVWKIIQIISWSSNVAQPKLYETLQILQASFQLRVIYFNSKILFTF